MRKPHILRGAKRTSSPQLLVFFDTETDQVPLDKGVKHVLNFGWSCFQRKRGNDGWYEPDWYRFTSASDFWGWVAGKCKPKTKLYVFCHNTNFDLPVTDIFGNLKRLGFSLSFACIDAPPTIIEFKREQEKIVVLDTLNYFRMPLAKIGEMIGLPKLPMPAKDAPQKDWDTYGQRDTDIIRRAMIKWIDFVEAQDYGAFKPTLAGQSFEAWLHRFSPAKIHIDAHTEALKLTRQCYIGGRTEAFHIGKLTGEFYLLDINSMYPYVMSKYKYPTKLKGYTTEGIEHAYNYHRNTKSCYARVSLYSEANRYGIRHNNRVVFPSGRYDAFLCGEDLAYAYAQGQIEKWHELAIYEQTDIFSEFVEHFYSRRLSARDKGDEIESSFYKVILNSCYGKTGQRGIVWENERWEDDLTAASWQEVDYQTRQITKYRKLGGLVQRQETEDESHNSFPAIAAAVTSYARTYLWELMNKAGLVNVFYCDTDSLLVNALGFSRLSYLLNDTTLGLLKCEGHYNEVEIRGAKDYTFGEKVKIKGIKKSARKIDENTFEQDKWNSLRGMLRAGDMATATTTPIIKRLSRVYLKGNVTASGQVLPFKMLNGV